MLGDTSFSLQSRTDTWLRKLCRQAPAYSTSRTGEQEARQSRTKGEQTAHKGSPWGDSNSAQGLSFAPVTFLAETPAFLQSLSEVDQRQEVQRQHPALSEGAPSSSCMHDPRAHIVARSVLLRWFAYATWVDLVITAESFRCP